MASPYRFPDEIIKALIARSNALQERSAELQVRARDASRHLRRLIEAIRLESAGSSQYSPGHPEPRHPDAETMAASGRAAADASDR